MVAEAISTVISRRKLTMGIALGAALTPRTVRNAAAQDATPATMSVDETGKVLNNYLTALLGGGDVGQYLADNVVVRFMDVGQDVSGREEVAAGLHALHGEQFEAQPELVGMIVGEGVVAVEATFIGTHAGEFGGIRHIRQRPVRCVPHVGGRSHQRAPSLRPDFRPHDATR
jgi:hypothetical protein